ncbi:hypothetical protein ERO13_D06G028200v2 [Gossypium hirsutum]|uniref:Uncharacterized protein n=1 Tax=Gossypium darwinii TaxID=34276 RepID=A0A5D2C470_GOSDA|nr:hypothetical protein ERO13_D06G028200v2 [Gossypium hirsutum]TYG63488.1 hypothetical protein ES288_D06G034000v1 [Gossypium darwinii]
MRVQSIRRRFGASETGPKRRRFYDLYTHNFETLKSFFLSPSSGAPQILSKPPSLPLRLPPENGEKRPSIASKKQYARRAERERRGCCRTWGQRWDFGFRLNWAGSKIGYYTFNFKLIQIFVSKAKEKKNCNNFSILLI